MRDQTYRDQVDPINADKRDRVIPRSNLRRLVVALDTAMVEQPYRVRGDFIYIDNNSTGTGTLKLNNTSEDPFPVLAQAGLVDMPFQDIFLSSSAQAGKVLNLWYGYRARFLSPSQNIATIGSITNAVTVAGTLGNLAQVAVGGVNSLQVSPRGYVYGTSFRATTALAANTATQIFSPASNVNGAILWSVTYESCNATSNPAISILAKTSAPASLTDGDALDDCATRISFTSFFSCSKNINNPVFIAAGKGLYCITNVAETLNNISARFTLL